MPTQQTSNLSISALNDQPAGRRPANSAGKQTNHQMVPVAQVPTVSVGVHTLTFGATAPGQASFMVLHLRQACADTAITLITDAPEQFQLAGDSRPAFGKSLSLTPPASGTYVHVRYAPARAGRHTGHLFIETPYASLTVDLAGRSSGLASALRRVGATDPLLTRHHPPFESARRWLSGLTLLTLSGLTYMGYQYRSDWLPAATKQSVIPALQRVTPSVKPALKPASSVGTAPNQTIMRPAPATDAPGSARLTTASADPITTPTNRPANNAAANPADRTTKTLVPVTGGETVPTPVRQAVEPETAAEPKTRLQPSPAPESTGESELERALNKKP